jgi:hypothetical protein
MTLQDRPLVKRSNAIRDSEVPKYVGKLERFLGHGALSQAQLDLDRELSHHGRVYRYWAQELRPWLFALRHYDQITSNGVPMRLKWPAPVREMVGDALKIASLHHCMPDDVRAKYRGDLLAGQHHDFMVEIHAAWHYWLEGYDVRWYPLSHEKQPEFRVRGGGLDFDVECRRFSQDLSEQIKTPAVADTCDTLYEVLLRRGLWGEVRVEFADEFRFDPTLARRWPQAMEEALDAEKTSIELDRVSLVFELNPSPSRLYTTEELATLALLNQHPEASCLLCRREGDSGIDPVVFRCRGPRKAPNELRDYIYKALKTKVTTQLAEDRAGVLFVRFTGVRDPRVFDESEGISQSLARLFARPHLSAVVLCCDDVAETDGSDIVHSRPAIVFKNRASAFPDVANARHVST